MILPRNGADDIRATVGEDGREDLRAVLNVPVIDETLGIKFMGSTINSDGAYDNKTLNDDVGGDDIQTYGAAAYWTPSDRFNLKFHYENFQDESDIGVYSNGNVPGFFACDLEGVLWPVGCASSDIADEDNVTGARKGTNDSETDIYIMTANLDFDNFLVTSITAYQDRDEHYLNNFDPSPADFLYLDYFNEWEQFSQEIRVTSQFSDEIQFIAGVFYWDVDYEQDWDVGRLHYNLDLVGAIVPGRSGRCWLHR